MYIIKIYIFFKSVYRDFYYMILLLFISSPSSSSTRDARYYRTDIVIGR